MVCSELVFFEQLEMDQNRIAIIINFFIQSDSGMFSRLRAYFSIRIVNKAIRGSGYNKIAKF